jgi:hypothetical protein
VLLLLCYRLPGFCCKVFEFQIDRLSNSTLIELQKRARATLRTMSAAADMEREAEELAAFLNSLPSDAEEVDLSSFELIEDFDDAAWTKLNGFKDTMKRVKLPPSLLTIRMEAFMDCS